MFRTFFLLVLLAATPAAAASVTLAAADGVKVFGDYQSPGGSVRGTIVLFHMAESSREEYAPIVPRLLADGFATLAIDQRSGGGFFSPRNETVAALGHSTGYAAALPDLEAALAFARTKHTPVIVLGSSYSAALVFVLASKHPGEVGGVMSFSPGEYLGGISVRDAAAKVTAPVFITSANNGGEIAAARAIFNAVPGAAKILFAPKNGVHGASTLREDRNKAGAAENWDAVEAFLARWH